MMPKSSTDCFQFVSDLSVEPRHLSNWASTERERQLPIQHASKNGACAVKKKSNEREYIVSSVHLASPGAEELSEFEYGLIISWNGFQRWMVRAMSAAGMPDFAALDVLVMHSIYHRGRPKRLADLCLVLNIENTHLVN